MTLKQWLRRQVTRMEDEIQASDVFVSDVPSSPEALLKLKRVILIHTFLLQELSRIESRATTTTVEAPVEALLPC